MHLGRAQGGLFIIGSTIRGGIYEAGDRALMLKRGWQKFLSKSPIKAFCETIFSATGSVRLGMQSLMMSSGLGGMSSNTVVLEFDEETHAHARGGGGERATGESGGEGVPTSPLAQVRCSFLSFASLVILFVSFFCLRASSVVCSSPSTHRRRSCRRTPRSARDSRCFARSAAAQRGCRSASRAARLR